MNAVVNEVMTEEQERELEGRRDDMFAGLSRELNDGLKKAIQDKTQTEARMLADEAQYWGFGYATLSKDDIAAGHDMSRGSQRAGTPVDNKTRAKTRTAAARISDMLFPTNSPNWGLRPSPWPDIPVEDVMAEYEREVALNAPPPAPPNPDGSPTPPPPPPPEPDYEGLAMKIAKRKCRKMAKKIADTLAANDYAKLGRQVIMEACKIGTGIVKGPYVKYVTRRHYDNALAEDGSMAGVRTEQVAEAGVARVSPWMFFPQRAPTIEEAEHSYELHIWNRTKVIQSIEKLGFYRDQVIKVLKDKPRLGHVESIIRRRAQITNADSQAYDNTYAVWEYHGPIETSVLETMGFEIEPDDVLTTYFGAVWFTDTGAILRVDMSPLEADDRLPYQVFNYEEDDTSIFGFGVPYVMRDDQYVIDLLWDAMLHNAAVTAGPQIAIEKGVLIPADGNYDIRGPKLWYKNDVDVSMQQAIEVVTIPSTLQNIMPLYQQAQQNADENTSLPLLSGDALAKMPAQAASGMVQLMNQQNIVQRQAAHSWDDGVTDPLITRLYHWHMEGEDTADIRGDYEVEVRGASYLLVKDTQAQHAQMLLQMSSNDPQLAALIHVDELYRVHLGFLDLPLDMILKTPEEVAADKREQQSDPMQDAEIAKTNAEAALADARAQQITAELQAPPDQGQMGGLTEKDIMEMEFKYAKLESDERRDQSRLIESQMANEAEMLRAASAEGIGYAKIHAEAEKAREKLAADFSLKEKAQASDDYFKGARLELDRYREQLRSENAARGFDSIG